MRWALVAILICSASAHAVTQANENIQWTLTDWLAQKKRISLMDQVFAIHQTSKIFQFSAKATTEQLKTTTTTNASVTSTTTTAMDYQADVYFSILNLEGEYQKAGNLEVVNYAAGLRVIGVSNQSTSLTVRYGLRTQTDTTTQEKWTNAYAEGDLQLYIIKQIGLTGKYRYYFPANSTLGDALKGYDAEAGLFVEFGAVRLQAAYVQQPLQETNNGVTSTVLSQGLTGSLNLLF